MSVQIPDLHVSTPSSAKGQAVVAIVPHRADANHTGRFSVEVGVSFDPAIAPGYPAGSVAINVDLTDSAKGVFVSTSIEQVNSFGRDTPTIALTGRCTFRSTVEEPQKQIGFSFWLLIANNRRPTEEKATPDIISFVVFESHGNRVAYGTGPVIQGDITVTPTPN